MFDPRKILVPVDFSEHSSRALDIACDVAARFDSVLHVLHCYQINPGSISPYGPVLPDAFREELRSAAAKRLDEWAARAGRRGLEAHTILSPLFPSEAIERASEEIGAGLIVIGTRGLTGLKHVLLGSVAERTVRTARCPVLTVKAEEDEA